MSDWSPQVVRIEKIEKHPNADALSIATVMGDYPVIIKTGQHQVDDLAGYINIDSIVPDTDQFYFLCPVNRENYEENGEFKSRIIGPKYEIGSVPEKYRIIKAKKIRGVYSMGMLIQIQSWLDAAGIVGEPIEGQSIIDLIGLKKWKEEVDDDVEFNGIKAKNKGKNAKSPPKGWLIPYYDIESVRKYLKLLDGEQDVILSEKINGSNSAFCHDGTELWVKSRNYFKKSDPDDMWWDLAFRYKLEEKMAQFPMKAFFGECAGQVKSYRYEATIEGGKLQTKLYFFDILDVKTMRWLDYDDFVAILQRLDLPQAPVLYRGAWMGKEIMYPYAEGKSTLNPVTTREGFVLKLGKERLEPKIKDGRLILKLVSETHTLNK